MCEKCMKPSTSRICLDCWREEDARIKEELRAIVEKDATGHRSKPGDTLAALRRTFGNENNTRCVK